MKKLLAAISTILAITSYTQTNHYSELDKFEIGYSNSAEYRIIVEMPFGKSDIVKVVGDTTELKNAGQVTVDIVYTSFGNQKTLQELNNKRIQKILSKFPTIKKGMITDINYYRQLDKNNIDEAKLLFHGVLIRFRLKQDKETMAFDLKKIDEIVYSKELKKIYEDKLIEKNKKTSSSGAVWDIRKATGLKLGVNGVELEYDSSIATESIKSFKQDSSIFKIFKRNAWRNYAIAGDVTGSMYPYTAQLLIWLKLESISNLTTDYTFFNDGDNKKDNEKQIGNTGGVYSKECKTYEDVEELIKSTMKKGGGGDIPENNIEALIKTEQNFKNISSIVMLADNWASIKDYSLISQLTKPVRIIVCGAINNNIRVDYLNLARMTNGSIHTIEEDIEGLAKMHEGETIQFGRKKYKIVNGSFVELLTL
jgi:hypothetical protein